MNNKTFIIAEAGVNHNGDLNLAKQLVDAAKEADVDAIKFQTFIAENCVSCFASKAEYQKVSTGNESSQLEMIKKLELSFQQFSELNEYCRKSKICFLSTPFDLASVRFLYELGIPLWKIPSGEITNLPYLVSIAKTNLPVILSTGMATTNEISETIDILKKNGSPEITLLHCNTEYPTPYEDANIMAMLHLKNTFGLPVGYSDHTLGIEAPIAAVALGAQVIEKHFTLDKNMEGPDHKASLEPNELKDMVQSIRNIERALGTGVKQPTSSELKNKEVARKSIVAKQPIKKGDVFDEKNITIKRPGNGISPMQWYDIIGKIAKKDFSKDELIEI